MNELPQTRNCQTCGLEMECLSHPDDLFPCGDERDEDTGELDTFWSNNWICPNGHEERWLFRQFENGDLEEMDWLDPNE